MTADIHLYTAPTQNGWKVSILLEELGIPYNVTPVRFDRRDQKSSWFLNINPNGRIPAIVDHGNDGFTLFESGAILWYLAERQGAMLPRDPNGRAEALQWLMFQMSGIGPMMGQAMFFQRIAVPNGVTDDFAIARYQRESSRLLKVLDRRLQDRPYLMGDDYSIIDVACYPYVRSYPWAGLTIAGLDHLARWLDRLDARPAVRRGVAVPMAVPAMFGEGDLTAAETANAARFAADVAPPPSAAR
ncbi:glutathione S-transferase family protein [Pelagibius sp.]|uniref:glutathione S-transferase family protein n=1 Tax=Pelagibius sp. TaxID=1931238 RepID=UPI003B502968